jgi:predicted double-glycine peptidase
MAIAFTRIVVQQYEYFPPVGLRETTGVFSIVKQRRSAIPLAPAPNLRYNRDSRRGTGKIMVWEAIATILFGTLAFIWGGRLGRVMVHKGATANDLFKGNQAIVLLVLGLYLGLVALAVNLPQWSGFPLEWRAYGLRVTWTVIRVLLLGVCGLGAMVCWRTARVQVSMVAIVGVFGLILFTGVESYFLSPIYGSLRNDLRPNGIYRQTSNSSCAAAALATLLRDWQVPLVSESAIAKHAQTSRLGTTMPQVIAAAQKFGFDGMELKLTWDQLLRLNRPGILAVWGDPERQRDPHAMVLMAMDKTIAIVADPAAGHFFTYSIQEFDRLWRREFVPIFQTGEMDLAPDQVTARLKQQGYKQLRQFQQEMGLKITGKSDRATALYLSGRSNRDQPGLDLESFNDRQVQRMGCQRQPGLCPW